MTLSRFVLGCISRPPVRPKPKRDTDRLIAAGKCESPEMACIPQLWPRAGLFDENLRGLWLGLAKNISHWIGIPDEAKLGTNLLTL